jgi:hypothetical protein
MYSYSCPFCQQRLLAPPERAGQKTICPKCLRPVTIPDPNEEPVGGPEISFNSVPTPEEHDQPSPSSKPPEYLEDWPLDPILADSSEEMTPPPAPPIVPPPAPAPPLRRMTPPPRSAPIPRSSEPLPTDVETPPPVRTRSQPVAEPRLDPRPSLPAPVRNSPAVPTPARPAPLVTRRAESNGSSAGLVVLNPTGLASVDLAAELTANLTMRMKPPQEPPSDLRLSTALAIIVTLVGLGLWISGVVFEPEPLPFVALLGGLLLAVGWVWAIHLASLQGFWNAIIALLPPITVWYLIRPSSDNGARPLLYVICGAMLLGLFVVGIPARERFQDLMKTLDPVKPLIETKPQTPAERLRTLMERRIPSLLQDHLEVLAGQDPRNAGVNSQGLDPADRADLANELKGILKTGPGSYDPTLRAVALLTMTRWCPEEARPEVIQALNAPEPVLRRTALQEAGRWPDTAVAQAVASRLSDDRETEAAIRALKTIGAPAEQPLIMLLNSDDQFFQMKVISLLESLGTLESAKALEAMSQNSPTKEIREEAARAAEVLRKSFKGK